MSLSLSAGCPVTILQLSWMYGEIVQCPPLVVLYCSLRQTYGKRFLRPNFPSNHNAKLALVRKYTQNNNSRLHRIGTLGTIPPLHSYCKYCRASRKSACPPRICPSHRIRDVTESMEKRKLVLGPSLNSCRESDPQSRPSLITRTWVRHSLCLGWVVGPNW